jgi:DNA polymerase III epsilon subunit-like protein
MYDQLLVSIDTETTGLVPGKHSIISIGASVVDQDYNEIDFIELLMRPAFYEISDEALACNGYSLDEINSFPRPRDTISELISKLKHWKSISNKKLLPVGHNFNFDKSHLMKLSSIEVKFAEIWNSNVDYHYEDTMMLAGALMRVGKLNSLSRKLQDIVQALNVTVPVSELLDQKPHRALYDARCAIRVHQKLLNLMRS